MEAVPRKSMKIVLTKMPRNSSRSEIETLLSCIALVKLLADHKGLNQSFISFQAGEKEKWGTNESVFVNILTNRSSRQLQATFEAYKHVGTRSNSIPFF